MVKLFFNLFVGWSFIGSLQAVEIKNPNPLRARYIENGQSISPGQNLQVRFDLDLAAEHWAYANQFKLKTKNANSVLIGEIKITPQLDFFDKNSGKTKRGIKDHAELRAQIEIPPSSKFGDYPVVYELTYQACTKDYCLLPITLTLPVNYALVEAGQSRSDNSFWQFTKIDQVLTRGGLPLLFFLVFVFGILTSFTPCIFPMIPITLAILGVRTQRATRSQSFFLSIVYVLGISLTYSVLGLIAAQTGALFGQFLGHPVAIGLISFIFAMMALSMFGLFEIQPPAFVRNRIQNYRTSPGYGGAFVSGIIAGLVASPCVGPVLVSILAYVATTKNLALGFSLLFVYALGLGQIFILLGTSSWLLQKLHKSGPWMVRIKWSFGVIMLAMAVFYARPLWELEHKTESPRIASSLNWQDYSSESLERAKQAGKPIIIDFWATWCAACFELEEKTFSSDPVRALSDKYVFFKFNATQSTPELEELQNRYGIVGLPHVVFYDASGKHREDLTLTGYEDGVSFSERMRKALAN